MSQDISRRVRRRPDRGSASIWALLLTTGAFTLLLGLIVDGGRVIDDRLESSRAAAQAARSAADALSQASVRSGREDVAVAAATGRARTYLRAAGMTGTVRVTGDTVTVHVTGRSGTTILSAIGIDSFPIRQSRTARAITEDDLP